MYRTRPASAAKALSNLHDARARLRDPDRRARRSSNRWMRKLDQAISHAKAASAVGLLTRPFSGAGLLLGHLAAGGECTLQATPDATSLRKELSGG